MPETNGLATRESLKSASERRYTVTEAYPIVGRLRLQSVTEKEKRAVDASRFDSEGVLIREEFGHVFARWAIATVVDGEGFLILGEIDIEWLSNLDYALTRRIMDDMNRHCEIGPYEPTNDDLKKTLTTAAST